MIPKCWLRGSNFCLWPPYQSSSRLEKAVRTMEEADEDTYCQYQISRIMYKTGIYYKVMLYLPHFKLKYKKTNKQNKEIFKFRTGNVKAKTCYTMPLFLVLFKTSFCHLFKTMLIEQVFLNIASRNIIRKYITYIIHNTLSINKKLLSYNCNVFIDSNGCNYANKVT